MADRPDEGDDVPRARAKFFQKLVEICWKIIRICIHYIADFVCRSKKAIVEIDGAQHAEKQAIEHDKKRTEFLGKNGYKVIRFWNEEVFGNIDGVLEAILAFLEKKEAD